MEEPAGKDKRNGKPNEGSVPASVQSRGPSPVDISNLNPGEVCTTDPQLTSEEDVGRQGSDRWKPGARTPFLDLPESGYIDRDRVLAREKRRVMQGVIGLRLRAARIFGDQAIHNVENNFLADRGMVVKLGYVTPDEFDQWVVPEKMVGKLD